MNKQQVIKKILVATAITSACSGGIMGCGTAKQANADASRNTDKAHIENLERELAQMKRRVVEMEFDIAWLQADLANMQSMDELKELQREINRLQRTPTRTAKKQAQLDGVIHRANALRTMMIARDLETAAKCDSLMRILNEKQR